MMSMFRADPRALGILAIAALATASGCAKTEDTAKPAAAGAPAAPAQVTASSETAAIPLHALPQDAGALINRAKKAAAQAQGSLDEKAAATEP